ncbi:MAG: SRPBCC family protein [Fimbriimonadaceae bacterium]|nr:SRPBCC family protein [Chitinophagales bacterium]
MHQFKAEQFFPIDKKRAWDFFSSPKNLSKITPPEMDFKILSPLNGEEIFEGMKIDYTVKPLFGISVRWQTEICKVKNQKYFTDSQLKGPYKVWEHTHTFTEVTGGVNMQDVINYQLPFGFIGNVAHSLFVRKKIENIFSYRKQILEKIFISNGDSNN